MNEEERIKLAIALQAFLQGFNRQNEKWDDLITFRSEDPYCSYVIDYCNNADALYPSNISGAWKNDEGEAALWKVLHMLIAPSPYPEIEALIQEEYRKHGKAITKPLETKDLENDW